MAVQFTRSAKPENKNPDRSKPAVIALAGNPNTGKSTIFNALTGLRQHTGNWPGKTVLRSQGNYIYGGQKYVLVDLPGTYSLMASSLDEEVARDFLCFSHPDATVVVVDATCLERNLNLVLQITEITTRVIVCLNLMDEARRKKISINPENLSQRLGVPIVTTSARSGEGLDNLRETIAAVISGHITPMPSGVIYSPDIEYAISILEPKIRELIGEDLNPRWVALRLLARDQKFIHSLYSQSILSSDEEECQYESK